MTHEQEQLLRELHHAVIGNKSGNEGLVPRVKKLEKYKETDQKFKWTVAGFLLAIETFWHFLTHGK